MECKLCDQHTPYEDFCTTCQQAGGRASYNMKNVSEILKRLEAVEKQLNDENELVERVKSLEISVDVQASNNDFAFGRLEALEKEVGDINQPDHTSARIEELEAENNTLDTDNSELIRKNNIHHRNNKALNDECMELRRMNESLKAENEDLKARNSNQLETIRGLIRKNRNLLDEIRDCESWFGV